MLSLQCNLTTLFPSLVRGEQELEGHHLARLPFPELGTSCGGVNPFIDFAPNRREENRKSCLIEKRRDQRDGSGDLQPALVVENVQKAPKSEKEASIGSLKINMTRCDRLREGQVAGFTQPRAHSFAQFCTAPLSKECARLIRNAWRRRS